MALSTGSSDGFGVPNEDMLKVLYGCLSYTTNEELKTACGWRMVTCGLLRPTRIPSSLSASGPTLVKHNPDVSTKRPVSGR